jgi:hypothetical protein
LDLASFMDEKKMKPGRVAKKEIPESLWLQEFRKTHLAEMAEIKSSQEKEATALK